MERRSNQANSAKLASVIRQFSPSRIERQLLAQVFEVVVTVRQPGQPTTFDSRHDQQPSETPQPSDPGISCRIARSAA